MFFLNYANNAVVRFLDILCCISHASSLLVPLKTPFSGFLPMFTPSNILLMLACSFLTLLYVSGILSLCRLDFVITEVEEVFQVSYTNRSAKLDNTSVENIPTQCRRLLL